MEESSAEALDSSTQYSVPPPWRDPPPKGPEIFVHFSYLNMFRFNTGMYVRKVTGSGTRQLPVGSVEQGSVNTQLSTMNP